MNNDVVRQQSIVLSLCQYNYESFPVNIISTQNTIFLYALPYIHAVMYYGNMIQEVLN